MRSEYNLNYLLINGNCGFPALKIAGAAIATVLGNFAALTASTAFVSRKSLFVNLPYIIKSRIRITRKILCEIYEKWLKVVSEAFLTRIGFLISGAITARIGSYDMASYAVGMHLMNINFALGSGFQSAAVAIVGRSYGQKNPEEIRAYNRQILTVGFMIALVMSAVMILTGRQYFGMFSDDAGFVNAGQLVCMIIAVIAPIQTLQIILNGCLRGIGDMNTPLKASVISVTIFQPTANFFLAIFLGLGHWGIWIVIFFSQLIRMILLVVSLICHERQKFSL